MSSRVTYGGFLGLEPAGTKRCGLYHQGIALSTARSCFYQILQHKQPDKVYLPYYICEAMLRPLHMLAVPYQFYEIDKNMEIAHPIHLGTGNEMIVYVNYFGIKSGYCDTLLTRYGESLILDNAQAFFHKGTSGYWSFNSARKFFGVADGAFMSCSHDFHFPGFHAADPEISHLLNKAANKSELAFQQFQRYEASLDCLPHSVSAFSKNLLLRVDYELVENRRRSNFLELHAHLKDINEFIVSFEADSVPLYYPFLFNNASIRQLALDQKLYIPTLWCEVLDRFCSGYAWEKYLSAYLLPLPIDQRYDQNDMKYIARTIKRLINEK